MTIRPRILAAMLIVAVAAPNVASAHPGHGDSGGVVHAFDHLIMGLDHLFSSVGAPLVALAVVLSMMALGGFIAFGVRAPRSLRSGTRLSGI